MVMTFKERVYAQIEHEETDWIPYTLGFEGNVAEELDTYYGSNHWRSLVQSAILRIPLPENGLMAEDTSEQYVTDVYGTVWRMDTRPFHHEIPALKKPTLDGYQWPDVAEIFDTTWETKARDFIAANQAYFLVGGFGYGLFERTWTLRGFENILSDCILEDDFYAELVEKVAEQQLAMVDHILKFPLDGVMFSDDWGYQRGILIGAARWRKFLKPHLAKMYQCVHEAGKIALSHCCGSVADILPDLIEIGLDVLESVQPEAVDMNPYELKRRFGSAITFWGGLGSQSTVQNGTHEEITAEVNKLSQEMGIGGGYILAPSKSLQPGTPVRNAAAVVEAFLKQAGTAF